MQKVLSDKWLHFVSTKSFPFVSFTSRWDTTTSNANVQKTAPSFCTCNYSPRVRDLLEECFWAKKYQLLSRFILYRTANEITLTILNFYKTTWEHPENSFSSHPDYADNSVSIFFLSVIQNVDLKSFTILEVRRTAILNRTAGQTPLLSNSVHKFHFY